MAVEDRYINSNARTTIQGNDIEIFIFYEEEGEVQLSFFVPTEDTVREGINFVGGDLGYTYLNITALFEIDSDGDLIVNDIDPSIYNINNDGDLILTTS